MKQAFFGTRIEMKKIEIGSMSLIGVSGEPPHRWANYFSFPDGLPCLNMWAENLMALKDVLGGEVEVKRYFSNVKNFGIITDKRVPKDYLHNKLCFTPARCLPSADVAKDMYETLGGDPTFELEQITDPKSYYAKRGGEYIDNGKFAYIRYNVPTKTRKLNAKYTMEVPQELICKDGFDDEIEDQDH